MAPSCRTLQGFVLIRVWGREERQWDMKNRHWLDATDWSGQWVIRIKEKQRLGIEGFSNATFNPRSLNLCVIKFRDTYACGYFFITVLNHSQILNLALSGFLLPTAKDDLINQTLVSRKGWKISFIVWHIWIWILPLLLLNCTILSKLLSPSTSFLLCIRKIIISCPYKFMCFKEVSILEPSML